MYFVTLRESLEGNTDCATADRYEKHVFGGTIQLDIHPDYPLFFNKGISFVSHGDFRAKDTRRPVRGTL